MSFVSDIFGGGDAADASREAADVQSQATREATAEQRRQFDQTRSDLSPFRRAGERVLTGGGTTTTGGELRLPEGARVENGRVVRDVSVPGSTGGGSNFMPVIPGFPSGIPFGPSTIGSRRISDTGFGGTQTVDLGSVDDFRTPTKTTTTQGSGTGLVDLVTDPNAQKEFITQNPFFESLANESQDRLFNNQAAKGKLGSGETAEALQNSILLLGSDLLNQNISQRQNIANMGLNAAAQTGQFGQQTANNVSDLVTQRGNAQAAGIVGAQNAETSAMNTAINTGLGIAGLFLSDKRKKTDIKKLGEDEKGLGVYSYRYKGDKEKRVGHMAQDVAKKFPEAVKTIADIKFIDYGKLETS